MTIEEVIELNEQNIRTALDDYAKHTYQTAVLDDVSDEFIETIAHDSAYAKQKLRELFRRSPAWDEQLQALVINGTRTHDPDYNFIYATGRKILLKAYRENERVSLDDIENMIMFFSDQYASDSTKELYLETIKRIAPKAYTPTKKLSRVFKSICQTLGIADETAGSDFQRLYAQFADELSAKRISFKLYVSINPAHFITMSNPKNDRRGSTLTSCHSFNSTEYEYNCGCSGYACDEVSIIAFTAADPKDPETLNNRKTTRQIFAYEPGNGVLLQSRLYNTSGGTRGAQSESKVYRDLIQRELAALESFPNLWNTDSYISSTDYSSCIKTGRGFGGYTDWIYSEFDAKVSIQVNHKENHKPLTIGTYGRCICCACEIDRNLYCDDCSEDNGSEYCDDCEEYFDETYIVYDRYGHSRNVCESCRDENYTYCERCGDYYENDFIRHTGNDQYICEDCLNNHYSYCEECEEYYPMDEVSRARDARGREIYVCEDCANRYYRTCDECGELVHEDYAVDVEDPKTGEIRTLCYDCEQAIEESEEESA